MTHLFVLPNNLAPYQIKRLNALVDHGIELEVVTVKMTQHDRPWKDSIETAFRLYHTTAKASKQMIRRLFERNLYVSIIFSGYGQPFRSILEGCVEIDCKKGLFVDSFESRRKSYFKEVYKKWWLPRHVDFYVVPGQRQAIYVRSLSGSAEVVVSPYIPFENRSHNQHGTSNSEFFLCISRFSKEKNILMLLSAYKCYRDEGGTRSLVLIGDGPIRSQVDSEIKILSLEDSVAVTGWLGIAEIRAYLQSAFAFILPSKYEPFGVVVAEALQFGIPGILSNKCGACDSIAFNFSNSLFFDPSSEKALTDKLLCLERDGVLYRALKGGAEKFSNENDLSTAVAPFLNLLNSLEPTEV